MKALLITLIASLTSVFPSLAGELKLPKKKLSAALATFALPEDDTKFQTWSPEEVIELTKTVAFVRMEFWRESEKLWDKWDEAILIIEEKEDLLRAVFRVRRWHTTHKYKGEIIRRPAGSETKEIEAPAEVSDQFAKWLTKRTKKRQNKAQK